jgi:DNA-binding XRE family transcriptional regulator
MDRVYNRIEDVLKWELMMSQKDFAEKIGIGKGQLCRIVNGQDLYLTTAKKIAKGLGKTVEEVWPDGR